MCFRPRTSENDWSDDDDDDVHESCESRDDHDECYDDHDDGRGIHHHVSTVCDIQSVRDRVNLRYVYR